MRRIRASLRADQKPDCTIEHCEARGAAGPPFDWTNLVAVCRGDLGGELHCDKSRGMRALSLHPADPRCDVEALVTFTADGRAHCDRHPSDIQALNLNHATLVRSRREIVDLVVARLDGADLTRLHAAEARWASRTGDARPEYAGVALPILRRLIRQREGRAERTRGQRG
jgi:hypothetical protein